jgi:hypothetical protein
MWNSHCSSQRVLSPVSPTRPRRYVRLSRLWRLRGGRGAPPGATRSPWSG